MSVVFSKRKSNKPYMRLIKLSSYRHLSSTNVCPVRPPPPRRRPPLPRPHPPRPPAGQPAKPGKRESYRSLISQSGPPATVKPPCSLRSSVRPSTFFDNLTIFEAPSRQSRVAPSPLLSRQPRRRHHFGALRTNKQTSGSRLYVAKSHC